MKSLRFPLPSRRSRAGFTLIELLTTVCIVAALSALLLPTLGKARSAAGIAQCSSNLRQFQMVYMQEVADNNMTLPWSYYYDETTSWTEKYASSVGGNWQLSDGGNRQATFTGCPVQRKKLKLGYNRRTYAINLPLTDKGTSLLNVDGNPPKLTRISQPSKTVLLTDGPLKSNGSVQNGCNSSDKLPDRCHDGKMNVIYFDGHAEPLSEEQFKVYKGSLPTKADNANTPISLFWLGI